MDPDELTSSFQTPDAFYGRANINDRASNQAPASNISTDDMDAVASGLRPRYTLADSHNYSTSLMRANSKINGARELLLDELTNKVLPPESALQMADGLKRKEVNE